MFHILRNQPNFNHVKVGIADVVFKDLYITAKDDQPYCKITLEAVNDNVFDAELCLCDNHYGLFYAEMTKIGFKGQMPHTNTELNSMIASIKQNLIGRQIEVEIANTGNYMQVTFITYKEF